MSSVQRWQGSLIPAEYEIVEDSEPEREERRKRRREERKRLDEVNVDQLQNKAGRRSTPSSPRQTQITKSPTLPASDHDPPKLARVQNFSHYAYARPKNRSLSRVASSFAIRPSPAITPSTSLSSNLHTTSTAPTSAGTCAPHIVKAKRDHNNSQGVKPSSPSSTTIEMLESDLKLLTRCPSCSLAWTTRKTTAQKGKHIQTCIKKNKLTETTLMVLIQKELQEAVTQEEKDTGQSKVKGKDKGKVKEGEVVDEEQVPRTLLEEVALQGQPKKKGRGRPKIIATIRDPEDVRDEIIGRAKMLLDGSNTSTPMARESDAQLPPQTQPFGESLLAKRFGGVRVVQPARSPSPLVSDKFNWTVDKSNPVSRFNEPTSVFDVSANGPMISNLMTSNWTSNLKNDSASMSASKLSSSDLEQQDHVSAVMCNTYTPGPLSLQGNAQYIRTNDEHIKELGCFIDTTHHSQMLHNLSSGLDSISSRGNLGNDDNSQLKHNFSHQMETHRGINISNIDFDFNFGADSDLDPGILHFEPQNTWSASTKPEDGHEYEPIEEEFALHVDSLKKTKVKGSREVTIKSITQDPLSSSSGQEPIAAPHKQTPLPEVAGGSKEGESSLEERMRAAILLDTELYNRILRYEPIPFDTFTTLALSLLPTPAPKSKPNPRFNSRSKSNLALHTRTTEVEGYSGGGMDDSESAHDMVKAKISGALKSRVRTFLDSEAVHYYGVGPVRDRKGKGKR